MKLEKSKISISNASISTNSSIFNDIHLIDKNIAIYQRDITYLQNELNICLESQIEFRHSGSIKQILLSLKLHLPNCIGLFDDISKLLELFGQVSQYSTFKVLLASINTNMCRKFHTDVNKIRMLCTYLGPGTLWLPDQIVNRDALNSCGDNECIVGDADAIEQAQTGDVVILKGEVYAKEGCIAVVHRSPTIEESGQKRLLLRIDGS